MAYLSKHFLVSHKRRDIHFDTHLSNGKVCICALTRDLFKSTLAPKSQLRSFSTTHCYSFILRFVCRMLLLIRNVIFSWSDQFWVESKRMIAFHMSQRKYAFHLKPFDSSQAKKKKLTTYYQLFRLLVHSSITQQIHKLFHNAFFTDCDLVLPLSNSPFLFPLRSFNSCLSLLPRLPVPHILPSWWLKENMF